MESLGVLTAIVGFMEFTKALFAQDYKAATIIAGSAFIGGFCGYIGVENLTILTGIQLGLSASGSYKGLSLIGRGISNVDTKKSSVATENVADQNVVQRLPQQ